MDTTIIYVNDTTPEATILVHEVGVAGAPGSGGDKHYEHNQALPLSSWAITHNLGKYPSITVVDTSVNTVVGEENFIDDNSLTITFSASFAGKAYLN